MKEAGSSGKTNRYSGPVVRLARLFGGEWAKWGWLKRNGIVLIDYGG
jgi:hypothetical protein